MFKIIVAIEVIFLVCMWSLYSDRLRSSNLWQQSNHASRRRHDAYSRNKFVADQDDDGHDNDDGKSSSEDVNEAAWERRLREESHQRKEREREKRRQQQEMRRALAKVGLLKAIPEQYKGPTLIIGGSDGSGTRAFAHAMLQLGVPMRIDDKESLDVHGSVLYEGQGWPPLAKSVLNVTHSANYNLSDLPPDTLDSTKKELQNLKDSFDDWQLKFEQRYYVRDKLNQTIPRASNVAIGFKAPVTMLLLPLLQEVFGKVKYLHIVRDGRDVALSTNKSPVQKFFSSMYTDAQERLDKYENTDLSPVLAMNLWNDWNTQVLEWEREHASDADFDYLVVRSEDLVDPSTKFETLARLAAFVGSPKTLEELCCMSREKEIDMGKSLVSSEVAAGDYRKDDRRSEGFWSNRGRVHPHGLGNTRQGRLRRKVASDGEVAERPQNPQRRYNYRTFQHAFYSGGLLSDDSPEEEEDEDAVIHHEHHQHPYTSYGRERHRRLSQQEESSSDKSIHSRYGKWRQRLKDLPHVSAQLHQEGAKGLATFGYEPASRFVEPQSPSPTEDFVCDETIVCEQHETHVRLH